MVGRRERPADRPHQVLLAELLEGRHLSEVVGQGAPGHRHHVAVQQAVAQQLLHHHRHAAQLVQAHHRIRAVRLQAGDQRHPFADRLDPLDRQRHLGFAGDRHQVQVHVGRAAHRVDGGDRVLERLHRHDVERPDAGRDQPVQRVDRRHRLRVHVLVDAAAGIVVGRMRGAARQHHADRLGHRAHRVGGEHRAAGAAARHHVLLELQQLGGADPAGLVGGAPLGVVHDRDVDALLGPRPEVHRAGRAGARIDDQAECVGARQRHQRGGAGLVAARDHDHRVAVMRVMSDLETVGHQVARHQAVAGGRRALGQRVRHRRRADHQPLAAARRQRLDQQVGDLAHAVVAAMGIGPGAGDRHHRAGGGAAVGVETGGTQLDARVLPVAAAVLLVHPTGLRRR